MEARSRSAWLWCTWTSRSSSVPAWISSRQRGCWTERSPDPIDRQACGCLDDRADPQGAQVSRAEVGGPVRLGRRTFHRPPRAGKRGVDGAEMGQCVRVQRPGSCCGTQGVGHPFGAPQPARRHADRPVPEPCPLEVVGAAADPLGGDPVEGHRPRAAPGHAGALPGVVSTATPRWPRSTAYRPMTPRATTSTSSAERNEANPPTDDYAAADRPRLAPWTSRWPLARV